MSHEPAQLLERFTKLEVGALAVGEERDRAAYVGLVEREASHCRARGLDLLLRDTSIRFRDVTHDLEGRAKERGAEYLRVGGAEATRLRATIELVTDQESDHRADPAATQDRADQSAKHLAVPHHGFLDRRAERLQHRALS